MRVGVAIGLGLLVAACSSNGNVPITKDDTMNAGGSGGSNAGGGGTGGEAPVGGNDGGGGTGGDGPGAPEVQSVGCTTVETFGTQNYTFAVAFFPGRTAQELTKVRTQAALKPNLPTPFGFPDEANLRTFVDDGRVAAWCGPADANDESPTYSSVTFILDAQ